MKACVKVLCLILLAFCSLQTYAQRRDFNYRFIAKLVSKDSVNQVVPNCHVLNKTQNLGTISDNGGSFMITANIGDTIEFSSVGFEKTSIAVVDSFFTNRCVITLETRTYELPEVNIGLLGSYDRFKADFMNKESAMGFPMDVKMSKWEVPVQPLPGQGGINLLSGMLHPITALYNLFSKEGKDQRRYLSIVNGTAEYIVLGNKFNGLLVRQLTGLEDDELVNFMSFCNFSKEYLHQTPEGEINREILRKYKTYMLLKNQWTTE